MVKSDEKKCCLETKKTYVTVKELAEKYDITKQAVHLWINNGRIKCLKIGKKTFRIPVEEVERLEREAIGC